VGERTCARGASFGDLQPSFSRRRFLATAASAAAVAPGAGAAFAAPAYGADLVSRGGSLMPDGADLIFRGGPIIPMAGDNRAVEALAVKNGKIAAVGAVDAVLGLRSASTRIIDLDGRTLLPGFIDPHQHTLTGALVNALFTDCGYAKYKTRAALLALFRAEAAKTPPGQWLLFTSFDNLLQGGDLTMADLDAVSKDHPILVYYINMHTAAGNGAAFAAASIPADIGDLPGGGRFGRDATGKFNGLIYEESALKKFAVAIPKITPQLAGKALVDWLKINASYGNTSVHEAGVLVFGNLLEGYERVASQSPCRASISLMYESMKNAEPYKKYGHGALATQIPDTLLTIYAMKIVGDGSNQTKSAAQTVPYLHDTEKGRPNFDAAELKAIVADVKANGWPISIHCNGDDTLDLALDAIEAAYGAYPSTGVNRIEHCTITRPEQIERMAKLGVQPSFLMNHVYFYGAAYRDQLFGPERAARMDPAADCVRLGLPFTIHTDAPCSNIGTLQLVQAAVTRKCSVDGSIVGPGQAVSLSDALRAVTVHAAGQIGMADQLGTLESGKLADLTILEKDPYAVDPEALMHIPVSETWVGGRKMFG
jgi:predicted amidohydrolase YtcJ